MKTTRTLCAALLTALYTKSIKFRAICALIIIVVLIFITFNAEYLILCEAWPFAQITPVDPFTTSLASLKLMIIVLCLIFT